MIYIVEPIDCGYKFYKKYNNGVTIQIDKEEFNQYNNEYYIDFHNKLWKLSHEHKNYLLMPRKQRVHACYINSCSGHNYPQEDCVHFGVNAVCKNIN